MKTNFVKVTPQQAAKWLEQNANNRPLSRSQVEIHKRNLESGQFRTTHQGIAFDKDGQLRDGQHRLQAIVESGIPATLLVTEGLAEEDLQAIDDGRRRSAQDMLSIAYGQRISALTTAIAREMFIGGWHLDGETKRKAPARQQLVDFYALHWEAVDYAADKLRAHNSGLSVSYIGAVIARAYHHVSRRKLDQFAKTLVTGIGGDDMEVVHRLRNNVMRALRNGARGIQVRNDIYAKLEQGLHSWANGEDLPTVRAAKTELFPLPEER